MPFRKPYFGISCFLFVLLNANSCFSQDKTKLLKGKVQNAANEIRDVLVVNLDSKKSTITDSLGLFTIEVKLGDIVRVSAVQYLTKDISISDTIFNESLIKVNLIENVINLNDVTVTPYNLTGRIDQDLNRLGLEPIVTSGSLDLPNADLDVMSQSERLLIEADRGKYFNFYVIALTINTHKILNRLSGRTKSFEEMIVRDEIMDMEREVITKFSKKTLAESFDIPETNVDGFLTYCMSQNDFTTLSERANTIEIWAYLKERSLEFKETGFVKE
ncbi:hypothetical protein [Zobellia nedashkovskayae]|uniref:hypothetical protein n=1 Tax=Zobellia nedashkovskayae TaxID=2779510 RepID=UPI001889CE95|nr:hypothetical protein [Zobellia nedashkovskayae]